MSYHFYCLSHRDETRKTAMKESFDKAGVTPQQYSFYDGVSVDDVQITRLTANRDVNRATSIMFGHLEMIDAFYRDETVTYGVFCENDILMHKDIATLLPPLLDQYTRLNLNVLLLGYLLPFQLTETDLSYPRIGEEVAAGSRSYTFHSFPDNLWGAQMYVLSKESARTLLDKYGAGSGYVEKSLKDNTMQPFASDWTITKDGRRALVYPMLAVENDRVQNNQQYPMHAAFHETCFKAHYEKDVFH